MRSAHADSIFEQDLIIYQPHDCNSLASVKVQHPAEHIVIPLHYESQTADSEVTSQCHKCRLLVHVSPSSSMPQR